jgi:hypothetical protein
MGLRAWLKADSAQIVWHSNKYITTYYFITMWDGSMTAYGSNALFAYCGVVTVVLQHRVATQWYQRVHSIIAEKSVLH